MFPFRPLTDSYLPSAMAGQLAQHFLPSLAIVHLPSLQQSLPQQSLPQLFASAVVVALASFFMPAQQPLPSLREHAIPSLASLPPQQDIPAWSFMSFMS